MRGRRKNSRSLRWHKVTPSFDGVSAVDRVYTFSRVKKTDPVRYENLVEFGNDVASRSDDPAVWYMRISIRNFAAYKRASTEGQTSGNRRAIRPLFACDQIPSCSRVWRAFPSYFFRPSALQTVVPKTPHHSQVSEIYPIT
jgi:hypothetical protein